MISWRICRSALSGRITLYGRVAELPDAGSDPHASAPQLLALFNNLHSYDDQHLKKASAKGLPPTGKKQKPGIIF